MPLIQAPALTHFSLFLLYSVLFNQNHISRILWDFALQNFISIKTVFVASTVFDAKTTKLT